ncbi:MAG: DUF177 domain-containing protein [Candidatus Latescibacteria bacterium]|nr:DUF177 domain-containing protein [Candidatus Latescibacterota bacterium]
MTKIASDKRKKLTFNLLHLKQGEQKIYQELTNTDLDIFKFNFIGPVILEVNLFKNGDTVVVSGTVKYKLSLCCVNCLENFEREFSEKIYQEYVKSAAAKSVMHSHLEEVDFVRDFYTTDFFDLTPLVRDTILLSTPVAFWCQPDCEGVK